MSKSKEKRPIINDIEKRMEKYKYYKAIHDFLEISIREIEKEMKEIKYEK